MRIQSCDANKSWIAWALLTIKEHVHDFEFLTEILHNNTETGNDLAGLPFTFDFTEAGPFAKFLGIRDFDKVNNIVLGA